MKKLVFCFVVILFMLISFSGGYMLKALPSEKVISANIVTKPDLSSDKIWSLVQDWRSKNNLPVYTKNQKLCDMASIRVQDIRTDWSHSQFVPRVNFFFGNNIYNIAENLAEHHINEEAILNAWLGSPTHADNLKSNYKYSCIVESENYVVQLFGNF